MTVQVNLSYEAYAVVCGLVNPSLDDENPEGVHNPGIFSESFDEIRSSFPVETFWNAVKAGQIEYDPEAGF